MGDHRRAEDLAGEKHAGEVHAHHVFPGLLGIIADIGAVEALAAELRGVDEDRRGPEPLADFRQGRLQLGLLGRVGADGDRLLSAGGQIRGKGRGRLVSEVQHTDLCAGFRQPLAHGAADTTRSAGHHGHAAIESEKPGQQVFIGRHELLPDSVSRSFLPGRTSLPRSGARPKISERSGTH